MKALKVGLHVQYWAGGPPRGIDAAIAEVERLGFDSIWTSEAYGSDGLTPLAWWGAKTQRVRLGSAILQMSARTPTATAMAAMTLDHLSGGRFVLGLGVSGPQVVEGWYGQPFPGPLQRTREYVEIVRRIIRREQPVAFSGEHYSLPYPGGTGLGKPLKSSLHPFRPDLPIYIGAEGPKNVALAAEIGDGWIATFYSPHEDGVYRRALAEGLAKRADGRPLADYDVVALVPWAVHDDVELAADQIRPRLALYVGGMGARNANFHYNAIARLGFEAEAAHIQKLYLEGRTDEAIAAVPRKMVEAVALVGPLDKIKDDLAAWRSSLATTLTLRINSSPLPVLRSVAELVLSNM